jgi:hypothetical protein
MKTNAEMTNEYRLTIENLIARVTPLRDEFTDAVTKNEPERAFASAKQIIRIETSIERLSRNLPMYANADPNGDSLDTIPF